jgi:hypothetical protein
VFLSGLESITLRNEGEPPAFLVHCIALV